MQFIDRRNAVRWLATAALASPLALAQAPSSSPAQLEAQHRAGKNPNGAVFLMTNDAGTNEIISYDRTPDGQLFAGSRTATGGRGSGGINDPLQSQGSLILNQDHTLLYAANAGSGTVSVFRVNGSCLKLLDQTSSGGSEPLAITEKDNYVYVLNGAAAGSVGVYRWNNKQLGQIPNSTKYLSGTSAGGSSITISPDKQWLAVTERLTNNIDIFKINSDGTLGPIMVNTSKSPGVFDAAFAPNDVLIVSEVGPAGATDAAALSSYKIQADGSLSAITQSVPTLGSANCWNVITPNGKAVYTSNAASGNISGFTIDKTGALIPIASTLLGDVTPGGNLDITTSGDGKSLYTLNSSSGTVSIFAIKSDGTLGGENEVSGLPQAAGFNGIAAY